MGILVGLLFHFFMWVVLPLLLIALLVGPRRTGRFLQRCWDSLFDRAQDPAVVLERVVHDHQQNIRALKGVVSQGEEILREIGQNLSRCEEALPALDKEAKACVGKGDDLGARAALSRLHLERRAAEGFRTQKEQEEERLTQARKRLHLLELQLRQYEVNRRILLNQLAEARTVEQQYKLANQFDPYNAVASWMRAEGMVSEEVDLARTLEQAHARTADLPTGGLSAHVQSDVLEDDLARLKAETAAKQAK